MDNPKAFGDALDLYDPRQLILSREHSNAILPATTARQILDPMIAGGHIAILPIESLRRLLGAGLRNSNYVGSREE
jgi:hypothetical protein